MSQLTANGGVERCCCTIQKEVARRLTATPGGTHPMGTANWIVPLKPPQYMELLGVGDENVMKTNEFGKRVLSVLEGGDQLMAWAIGVEDIDAVGALLERPVFPGQWEAPDGSVGRWRNVFADMKYFGDLPFFIQYDSRVREPVAAQTVDYGRDIVVVDRLTAIGQGFVRHAVVRSKPVAPQPRANDRLCHY